MIGITNFENRLPNGFRNTIQSTGKNEYGKNFLRHCLITITRRAGAAEWLSKWGAGTKKKGHFLEKKGYLQKGNLKAKIYNFLDIGVYPYIVITIIRVDFNICFTLYALQDIA